jgi:diphthine methyl ester synthase
LHSLVLLGRRTHELESEYVREFAVDKEGWDMIWKRDYEGRQ